MTCSMKFLTIYDIFQVSSKSRVNFQVLEFSSLLPRLNLFDNTLLYDNIGKHLLCLLINNNQVGDINITTE